MIGTITRRVLCEMYIYELDVNMFKGRIVNTLKKLKMLQVCLHECSATSIFHTFKIPNVVQPLMKLISFCITHKELRYICLGNTELSMQRGIINNVELNEAISV